jgi:hypothetical protein
MNPTASRISGVTKDLYLQWHQTRDTWRDAKAEEFNQKYLQDLWSTVDKTLGVIEQLDQLLARIRKDCE